MIITKIAQNCLLAIFAAMPSFLLAQEQSSTSCDSVYTFAENPPQYPGGMKGFYDFLKGFHYDEQRPEDPVAGKFNFHITVDKSGKPIDIQVSPESDQGLAIREYLHKMQSWTPASTREGQVCYKMKIPAYVHYK